MKQLETFDFDSPNVDALGNLLIKLDDPEVEDKILSVISNPIARVQLQHCKEAQTCINGVPIIIKGRGEGYMSVDMFIQTQDGELILIDPRIDATTQILDYLKSL